MSWRFELADSSTFSKIGELTQAGQRSLILTLNRPGAFSFQLPLDDEMASFIEERITCVLVKKDGVVVWSGPVWTIEETAPNTLQVGCVGWLQTLERRLTRNTWGAPLIFNDIDAGAIVQDLILRAKNEAISAGGPYWISPGTTETSQLRDASYQPDTPILQEIYNLAALESGFDFLVDPVTRTLDIVATSMVDRPNVIFEWGVNLSQAGRSSDSERMVNRYIANGANNLSQAAIDPTSIATYGLIEEAQSLSDVTSDVILQAYAQAEIALRAQPLRTHTFEPRKATETDPLLFRDCFVGDKVYLKVMRGRLNIARQAVRLFSVTLSFDELGNEQMTSVSTLSEG